MGMESLSMLIPQLRSVQLLIPSEKLQPWTVVDDVECRYGNGIHLLPQLCPLEASRSEYGRNVVLAHPCCPFIGKFCGHLSPDVVTQHCFECSLFQWA